VTVLAIDTSEANCSAALLTVDGKMFAASEPLGRGHAERLLPMIEELLAQARITYGDINRIAVTTGPGTFTGLRVGLSVARGLALSLGVPCVGLSGLIVLAAQAKSNKGFVHSVIKGRGGQVFYQAFEVGDANMPAKALGAAENLDADEARMTIENRSGYVLGSGMPLVMGREAGLEDVIDPAVLAALSLSLDPENYVPEPFYLREADAVIAKPIIKIRDQ